MEAEVTEQNLVAIVTILREKIKTLENMNIEVDMTQLLEVLKDLKKDKKKPLIDSKNLVKVLQLEKDDQYRQWSKDVMIWISGQDVRFKKVLEDAEKETSTITSDDASLMLEAAGSVLQNVRTKIYTLH